MLFLLLRRRICLKFFHHLCHLACVCSTSFPLKPSVAMASSSAPYLLEAHTTVTRTGTCVCICIIECLSVYIFAVMDVCKLHYVSDKKWYCTNWNLNLSESSLCVLHICMRSCSLSVLMGNKCSHLNCITHPLQPGICSSVALEGPL